MHDAWHYLRIMPSEFYSLSPRELTILIRAQKERTYDNLERMAHGAIMGEIAARNKRPKITDLFKRPTGAKEKVDEKTRIERLKENTRHANDWLAKLTSSGGVSRKE